MARKIKTLGVSGDSVFGHISDEISSESHAGEGSLTTLNLGDIDIDPKNARVIGRIAPNDIELHLDNHINLMSEEDPDRRAYFLGIQELANSIKENGLLHPIIVIVIGERYQIMAGERRYLAHLLLRLSTIRAFVRPADKNPLSERAVSLIENVQRENLTTGELISVIHQVDNEYKKYFGRLMTGMDLSALIHKSERTCAVYLQLCRAPVEVYKKVASNKISINEARAMLVSSDIDEKAVVSNKENEEGARKGRKRKSISLGKVQNSKVGVIKKIIQVMEGNQIFGENYKDVEWDNPDKVQKVWDAFLTKVAKRYGE